MTSRVAVSRKRTLVPFAECLWESTIHHSRIAAEFRANWGTSFRLPAARPCAS
jgi:hypothetical protein